MSTITATDVLAVIGPDLMDELCDKFGGQKVYIPQVVPDRSEKIAADFNRLIHGSASVGIASELVALENGVSTRTVRRVIHGR